MAIKVEYIMEAQTWRQFENLRRPETTRGRGRERPFVAKRRAWIRHHAPHLFHPTIT